MLATGARAAHRINADIGGGDVDIHLFRLGQNRHGRGRGMDTPLCFGFRHPLYAVDTGFELQPGENPLALHMGGHILDAAKVAFLHVQNFEPPALRLGKALIHAQEVSGEKCGLIAAGAGADLKDCRAGIGGILGQKRQTQPRLHLGDACLQLWYLILGQTAHFRIGKHGFRLVQIAQHLPVGGDFGGDRLQIGIFPAEGGDFPMRGTCRKLRFEKIEAAGDLREFIQRYHGRGLT